VDPHNALSFHDNVITPIFLGLTTIRAFGLTSWAFISVLGQLGGHLLLLMGFYFNQRAFHYSINFHSMVM
jgi:hypothetical protein